MSYKTIIPYVGGKQKTVKLLASYFPKGLTEMGSPFMGGGSVEIYMQAKGVRVVAGDALRELCVFWKMMYNYPKKVADGFKNRIPIEYPLDRYREELRGKCSDLDTAVLFYILIECGFSHILARTGGAPRNTQNINRGGWRSRYARLRRFTAPNLSVYWYDCFEFMRRFPDLFLYCDPPYPNADQNLYGFSENLHVDFPHERFAQELLSSGRDFVLSYGDCELIRELYSECLIDTASWNYGAKPGSVIGHELIIRPRLY